MTHSDTDSDTDTTYSLLPCPEGRYSSHSRFNMSHINTATYTYTHAGAAAFLMFQYLLPITLLFYHTCKPMSKYLFSHHFRVNDSLYTPFHLTFLTPHFQQEGFLSDCEPFKNCYLKARIESLMTVCLLLVCVRVIILVPLHLDKKIVSSKLI